MESILSSRGVLLPCQFPRDVASKITSKAFNCAQNGGNLKSDASFPPVNWGHGCSGRLQTRDLTVARTSSSVVVVPSSASDDDSPGSRTAWEAFGTKVSGEWDGYSAEFNFQGEPVQLPSNVVPDAFREWGVEIYDWQSQCPTLTHPTEGQLWYKIQRLLPTVGCEADAATIHSVEECDAQIHASALAYHEGGSYTGVWRGKRVVKEKKGSGPGKVILREGDELGVEQCLVHNRSRVRVFQELNARRRILVSREIWEGPFRNGESLGGCAISSSAFATQACLLASEISGSWETEIYSAGFESASQGSSGHSSSCVTSELIRSEDSEVLERPAAADNVIFLPKDMWTVLKDSGSGGFIVETGWLVQRDLALVSVCEFESSNKPKRAYLRLEKRTSSA